MPFKSEAQRKFMFAKHPQIAKKWAHEYGIPKNLPEHKRKYLHGSGKLQGEACLRKVGALE